MKLQCEDVEHTFRTWLTLAEDRELLALLALVQGSLAYRGWHISLEIAGPSAPLRG
jgi:hypothetical protein